ncbi:thiamine phosphate synthase [Aliifodinibius salicampi]|uniref:Thiamine-phosphate synthase n=1 Tax=Fodinibius salicampi TaxID=1920655 RepID=A0ABT3Q2V3_9BACT|nr:thiamine phosphate synthase [Fodinibius salicampi]MCW9714445.1 thiamine phosphate synthase [Fodinibius salicampi]
MNIQDYQGIYLITDTQMQDRYSHVALADAAYKAGVKMVQYRAKNTPDSKALKQIRAITELESKKEHLLIVNDRPDLAKAGGADGVHLGQDDIPLSATRKVLGTETVIGGTASNLDEACQVSNTDADYVALGHIFKTTTKQKDYEPRGLDTLRQVRAEISGPLVAIGGITLQNAPEVIVAGADILAVSSAICTADDPQFAARTLAALFE